jgi:hypothetical protein
MQILLSQTSCSPGLQPPKSSYQTFQGILIQAGSGLRIPSKERGDGTGSFCLFLVLFFSFWFFVVLMFELRPYTLSHSTNPIL